MEHRETLRDPVVWAGAIAAVLAHAWVFFAGDYLPYIDWSNHVGLTALFSHGGPYVERSFLPTPYLLFYAFGALLGRLTGVVAAAKIALLTSSALFTFGAAFLAESTGRDPRLGLVAPLALFGLNLGWGFASFLFAMPLMLFVFAWTERVLRGPPRAKTLAGLAAFILLTYLGHAMVLAVTALAVFIRTVTRSIAARSLRPLLTISLAALPAGLAAIPVLLHTISTPWHEAGTGATTPARLFSFAFDHQLDNLGGDLLDRGGAEHWTTMYLLLGLLGLWLLLSLVRPRREPTGRGLEIYAACLAAVYLLGPTSIEWPFAVWMVHARFATLAALLLFLLPRVDLSGRLGGALAGLPLLLVLHNASINRDHILWFNERARLYDPVRRAVPKGARVLALTVVPPGDLTHQAHALGSLYFYHLADGASYTAFLFDQALQPLHLTKDRPRAPFWRAPGSFNPQTHGMDFDYLVLRGDGIISRAAKSGHHVRVGDFNGWAVFRTVDPTPFPEGWAAPPIEEERGDH